MKLHSDGFISSSYLAAYAVRLCYIKMKPQDKENILQLPRILFSLSGSAYFRNGLVQGHERKSW